MWKRKIEHVKATHSSGTKAQRQIDFNTLRLLNGDETVSASSGFCQPASTPAAALPSDASSRRPSDASSRRPPDAPRRPPGTVQQLEQPHSRQVGLKAFFIFATSFLVVILSAWAASSSSRRTMMLQTAMQTTGQKGRHVIVIGGGLAGLSAAAEALALGVRVTLIDKERLGGNSIKATSGINGAPTRHQRAANVTDDSVRLFATDVLRSGRGKSVPSLVDCLASRSSAAIAFVEGKLGFDLSNVAILGGHSRPRTHRPANSGSSCSGSSCSLNKAKDNSRLAPIGFLTISALRKYLEDPRWNGQLQIRENTRATDLHLSEAQRVDGSKTWRVSSVVVVSTREDDSRNNTSETVDADAVILCSGGFAADFTAAGEEAAQKVVVDCSFTTNGPFATGDLLKIGRRLGLDTVDLDQVQLHPTGFIHPDEPLKKEKFLCPEVFRGVVYYASAVFPGGGALASGVVLVVPVGAGGVLVNHLGSRFVDELSTRDTVSAGIMHQGSSLSEWTLTNADDERGRRSRAALLLMNEHVRREVGEATFDFYKKRGFIFEGSDIDSLCKSVGMDASILTKTLQDYSEAALGTITDAHGKTTFPTVFAAQEPFFYAFVTPAVHYTMGGLKINEEAYILRNGIPMANLLAAGEVSGGLHGANRLGGNGMLESVVFGRLAAKNAVAVVTSEPEILREPHKRPAMPLTVSSLAPLLITEERGFMIIRLKLPSPQQLVLAKLGQPIEITYHPSHRNPEAGDSSKLTEQFAEARTSSIVITAASMEPGIIEAVISPTDLAQAVLLPGDEVQATWRQATQPHVIASALRGRVSYVAVDDSSYGASLALRVARLATRSHHHQAKLIIFAASSSTGNETVLVALQRFLASFGCEVALQFELQKHLTVAETASRLEKVVDFTEGLSEDAVRGLLNSKDANAEE